MSRARIRWILARSLDLEMIQTPNEFRSVTAKLRLCLEEHLELQATHVQTRTIVNLRLCLKTHVLFCC